MRYQMKSNQIKKSSSLPAISLTLLITGIVIGHELVGIAGILFTIVSFVASKEFRNLF